MLGLGVSTCWIGDRLPVEMFCFSVEDRIREVAVSGCLPAPPHLAHAVLLDDCWRRSRTRRGVNTGPEEVTAAVAAREGATTQSATAITAAAVAATARLQLLVLVMMLSLAMMLLRI